jgi:hypothetical protein
MNVIRIRLLPVVLLLCAVAAFAQQENVPISSPVYNFLKRMEVKGVIERYHDAVLPLSRSDVAEFLTKADENKNLLSAGERGWLDDFLAEFRYDISGKTERFHRLIDHEQKSFEAAAAETFSNREKFLYFHSDSSLSFFANLLLDVDARMINGDALGKEHTEYLQFGGRFRGTILDHLGYYAQWTNAAFWGSRELLYRDPVISQIHALGVGNVQNFDIAESYLRYGTDVVSLQVGRERLLWGTGYDQKMTLSDNVRPYDFVRFDARYKSIKYSFVHAWLVGTPGLVTFTVAADTSARFGEEVAADKFYVAHRVEFALSGLFDLGFQEMLIYSNRSPDLAYLNPFAIIESSQRSRGERDNAYWAFDIQLHFIPNIEVSASIAFDDINVPIMFSDKWNAMHAWQLGLFYADPFGIPNTSLMAEYTRIEPYMFTHARSRDDNYTSLGRNLGPRIGPNADSWFFRADYLPLHNLSFSARASFDRKGENTYDANGQVVKNVGSSELLPHRGVDPETKIFLDGALFKTRTLDFRVSWEIVNQLWLEGRLLNESVKQADTGFSNANNTLLFHLRTEF